MATWKETRSLRQHKQLLPHWILPLKSFCSCVSICSYLFIIVIILFIFLYLYEISYNNNLVNRCMVQAIYHWRLQHFSPPGCKKVHYLPLLKLFAIRLIIFSSVKWEAWNAKKGISKQDAQNKYVEYVESLKAAKQNIKSKL